MVSDTQECGCKAWIFKEDGSDMYALHQHSPIRHVSHTDLSKVGVLYYKMEGLAEDPQLEQLRQDRGYTNFDVVNITDKTPAVSIPDSPVIFSQIRDPNSSSIFTNDMFEFILFPSSSIFTPLSTGKACTIL